MTKSTTPKTQHRSVTLPDGSSISYELAKKKVKNINLRIRDNGTVSVSAPSRVPVSYIDSFVSSRAEFILDALESFKRKKAVHRLPAEFNSGDTVRILGKDITLMIKEGTPENVTLTSRDTEDAVLYITLKNPLHTQKKRQLFLKWRANLTEEIFKDFMEKGYLTFKSFGVPVPTLRITEMKSRWGSCTPSTATITLNSRLIEYPLPAIEYVVWHEYNHFLHMDHSAAFHASMTRLMPDWKKRKAMLSI
ncbi:hypothetical protein SAMN06296386_102312 [Lachnospiraceae bacterium]|nr:hypothetical protein SAMN06296386_102312 [Lachnospiraceae bacterium]